MANYLISHKALEDLTEIWDYTKYRWSEKQAKIYLNKLIDIFDKISNKPNLGSNYEINSINFKGIKVNSHIIFYQIVNLEQIQIIRILHVRMDIKRKLE